VKYGYCTVDGLVLGLGSARALGDEGSRVLDKLAMEGVGFPEVVGDVDACSSAARFFWQEQVDALVVNISGWIGGGEFLRFVSELGDLPIILWGFGKGPTLTLVCLMEATSDLTKTGRTNAHDYLRRIISEGFEHHVCAVHGYVTRELQKICDSADIRSVVFAAGQERFAGG